MDIYAPKNEKDTHMKILAISGSFRKASYNTGLLRAAKDEAPEGVELEFADFSDIPLYNGDVEASQGIPDSVQVFARKITDADGLLISTPEYNFSIPGTLKNMIDWVSRTKPMPFAGKPTAILGAAPGPVGTARVQYELRKVLSALTADLVLKPEVFVGFAASKFDDAGRFTDEGGREFIGKLVTALTEKIKQ